MTSPVALVTGASKGIGAAIAEQLARDGYDIAVGYGADGDGALRSVASVEAVGRSARSFRADLRDPEAPERLVEAVVAWQGRLDLLVNNAGTVSAGSFGRITAAGFDAEVAVNLRAPLLLAQEAVPHLERATNAGIVNISSLNGSRMPSRAAPVYSAAKAGLDVLTRSLAATLGPSGIRVNAVAPGATSTDMFLLNASDEARAFFVARTALGRLGTPEEVAAIVGFLASERSGWLTGQIIAASGGFE